MTPSALTDLGTALSWLRDVARELADVPTRLHTSAGGYGAGRKVVADGLARDGLGAPPFSSAFVRHIDGGPYAVVQAPREVACPEYHPPRRYGQPLCALCEDTGFWMTATDVYAYPLRAALSTLSRARSGLRPHPRVVVDALLREGCEPAGAAERLPGYAPDDRRFLSALRALYDSFSYTAMAPARRAA